jgi:hypothetical protein
MHKLPTVDAALIKITGVFSFKRKKIEAFISKGYTTIPLSEYELTNGDIQEGKTKVKVQDDAKKFYRDRYYKEFASLMFTGESEENAISALYKQSEYSINLTAKGRKARSVQQELFLFRNETGIFSITVEPEVLDFDSISDVTYAFRFFDTEVEIGGKKMELHDFIAKEVLCGIPLRGTNVESDEYSGSKFKVYTVINTVEVDDGKCYSRDHLVYEIGTASKLGTMADEGYNAPSHEYYEELMENSIKVFKNYTGLALLDSFTVIGHGIYQEKTKEFFKYNSYNRVYFAIYVFNLYVRYNIFRFNTVFGEEPIKTRDSYQDFLNNFNFSHISFNFLPNIFYKKMRGALLISEEIEQFEKRLNKLAAGIQEEQEKRQASLLALVSVLTGLSSARDIFTLLEGFRYSLSLSGILFYTTLIVVLLLVTVPVLAYLFPQLTKKVRRKLKRKMAR